jgi:hypothetical protein
VGTWTKDWTPASPSKTSLSVCWTNVDRDRQGPHRSEQAGVSPQALKDRELLAVSKDCHPETLRQMRWANAQLKVQSAQTMVS